jgi:CxxC-x17-CxxC domain-containing protein
MEFHDQTLTCRDCGGPFVFTAGEQGFYVEKGLINQPQRCALCRARRRRERSRSRRPAVSVTCARCGQDTTVPFMPRFGLPVYCDACFDALAAPESQIRT